MQKLGILASVLLVASVIIGPVGLSHAQTVDTNKAAKMSFEEKKAMMEQEKQQRLEAQKQKAAEIKAKMNAKKEAAAKEIEAAIAARNAATKEDLPRTEDIIAKLKAMAADAIDAKKSAGGPSKVQKALEAEREAYMKRVQEHKAMIPKAPEKDVKYVKEDKKAREKTLKSYDAVDQYSKESGLKKEYKKAEEKKQEKYSQMHHKNRQ